MFDEPSLRASLPVIESFSKMEGLDAHGRSASIRLLSKSPGLTTEDTGDIEVEFK
jgi:hypothetical protein